MKNLKIIIVLIFTLLLTSCSDALDAAHGLATFIFIVLKWGLILTAIVFIIAFIVGLFNKK